MGSGTPIGQGSQSGQGQLNLLAQLLGNRLPGFLGSGSQDQSRSAAGPARYMAENPGQFQGLQTGGMTPLQLYQRAHYIRSNPNQFNVSRGENGNYSIAQAQPDRVAQAAQYMVANPNQFQGLQTGGLTPEQLYQRAHYIQSNPGQFNSTLGADGAYTLSPAQPMGQGQLPAGVNPFSAEGRQMYQVNSPLPPHFSMGGIQANGLPPRFSMGGLQANGLPPHFSMGGISGRAPGVYPPQ